MELLVAQGEIGEAMQRLGNHVLKMEQKLGYKVKERKAVVEALIESLIKYDREEFCISVARTHSRKMAKDNLVTQ